MNSNTTLVSINQFTDETRRHIKTNSNTTLVSINRDYLLNLLI